jgi:signal recognition particle GTPase
MILADAKQPSFLARMRAKLNRPGSWLSYDLGNLVPGRKIDAEILDELETRLLTADVGVEATEHILEVICEIGKIQMCMRVDQHRSIVGRFGETPIEGLSHG